MSVLESSFEKMSIYTVNEVQDSSCTAVEQIEIEDEVEVYYEASSTHPHQVRATVSIPVGESDSEQDRNEVHRKAYVILGQVDNLIEKLRMDALRIEDEKESILSSLDSLKNSAELQFLPESEYREIADVIDLLATRVHSIEICVNTDRSQAQEEALHKVNGCIDQLVLKLQEDPVCTKATCVNFLQACDLGGSGDVSFSTALSQCTPDDRKRIRRRLQGLLGYMESYQRSVQLEVLE